MIKSNVVWQGVLYNAVEAGMSARFSAVDVDRDEKEEVKMWR